MSCGLRDYTLISPEDQDRLHSETISVNLQNNSTKRAYVIINKTYKLLHRYLLNFPDGEIDHIDNDPLNNTRENLRVCSRQENCNNKWIINKYRKSILKGLTLLKNGNIYWEYQDKVLGKKFRSKNYFSQKFAYDDYCNFKKIQMGVYFQHKDLSSFALEMIIPRKAKATKNSSTGYLGVYKSKPNSKNKYRSQIKINGKVKSLGSFGCKIEASRAYDRAMFEAYGSIAILNHPKEYIIFL